MTVRFGSISVTPVDDGIGRVRPDQLYAAGGRQVETLGKGARPEDWAEHPEFCDADGRLEMPIGTFVVRTADRVMLVDAGYGPLAPATVRGPRLPDNLLAAGIDPSEITDVLLTHLHLDHHGWCAVDGVATFVNATYRCHRDDWEHFVARADDVDAPDRAYREAAARALGPIADRFDMWDVETTIAAGVDAVPAPGHTPGSTLIVVGSGGERGLLLGDAAHHPVQLLDDEWERVVDVDPPHAHRTQIAIAQQLITDQTLAVGAHFPGLQFGRIAVENGRRRWLT